MSEAFIRTRRGALNLRHVRRIYEEKPFGQANSPTAVTDDGAEYDVEIGSEALDSLCMRIVPASPEDRACFLAVDPDNPTIEGVWEQHAKIIAWGISVNYGGGCYGVEPIYIEKPSSNQMSVIRCPDGTWLLQEDMSLATLDEAKAEALRRHIEADREKQPREDAGQ
jgi:hypothetical protein